MDSFKHQIIAVAIPVGPVTLHGELQIPPDASGVVLFVHGGGSARHSSRQQRVATSLHQVGLATLLLDLAPEPSEPALDAFSARQRNNHHVMAERLTTATAWVRQQASLADFAIGYFGASEGAETVLIAASENVDVDAIVTRGGRLDLPDATIKKIRSPTMLIVGGNDDSAVSLNLETWARLRCAKAIEIIPGASHLFEEPGALDNVAALTARWFSEHLRKHAHLAACF